MILISLFIAIKSQGLCKPRAGDIYRTIQPVQMLSQRQHINSKKKTFKLVHKHSELDHKPIGICQCVLFINSPCHKKWIFFCCILGLFSNKSSPSLT